MLETLLLIFHLLLCFAVVILILLHQGKGAEMGAAFGSGASQTIFGSQGTNSVLVKVIGAGAALFFITSLTLGYVVAHQNRQDPLQNLTNAIVNSAAQSTSTVPSSEPATISIPQDQIPQN